jgi:hypothetical protein
MSAAPPGAGVAEPVPTRRRDAALDLLRGFLLSSMVVDHLRSFPSIFDPLTGRGLLFVSAAEGFVLVSGLLVGRLRGAAWRAGRAREASRWLWHRALKLALWSIGLSGLFTLAAIGSGIRPAVSCGVFSGRPLEMVWQLATLRYTYGLHDILPVYAVFLGLSPLVLWVLGRGYSVAVLTGSAAIWLWAQTAPRSMLLTGSYFSEASWQFLFFLGVVIGWHFEQIEAWVIRLLSYRWLKLAFVVGAIMLLCLWFYAYARMLRLPIVVEFVAVAPPPTATWKELLYGKSSLGPIRFGLALTWFGAMYLGLRRFAAGIVAHTGGRYLRDIGQHSLFVYILQALLLFFPMAFPTHDFVAASLRSCLALLILVALVKARRWLWFIPN